MDLIIIRDLAVSCHVGVPDLERASPQRLLISLEIGHDLSTAAGSDDLAKTIDYSQVCRGLTHFGEGRTWKLIETLAVDIANWLQDEFSVQTVTVEIKKFVVPDAEYVAVRLTRNFGS
jgi:FolB domain-containing protein